MFSLTRDEQRPDEADQTPDVPEPQYHSDRWAHHRVSVAHHLVDRAILLKALANPDNEVLADGLGQLFESVKSWANATIFHASDRRLRSSHAIRQFDLSEASFDPKSIDEFTGMRK